MDLRESWLYRNRTPEVTEEDAYLPDVIQSFEFAARGDEAFAAGDLAGALSYYDDALDIDPTDALTLAHRALVQFRRNDPSQALSDIGAALTLREDPDIYALRAFMHAELGHWEESLADCQAAFDLDFEDPLVYQVAGRALTGLRAYAEANRMLNRAIALGVEDPETYLMRARARLHVKKLSGARADFNRARSLARDDPEITTRIRTIVEEWSETLNA